MPSARGFTSTLAAIALSCGTEAPPPAVVAPAPSSSVPEPAAPAVSSSSEPSDAAPPRKDRKQELLAAADRLMGGELTRAEERCASEPLEKREACVDAELEEHGKKLADEAMRSLRSLELLMNYGNARCTAAPVDEKDACVGKKMEALLTKMSEGCPPPESDEGHACIVDKVLKHLGP